MANKPVNPLDDPPTASSSSDDVESSSGEEQISHSSSEPKDPAKIPTTKTLKSPSTSEKTTTAKPKKKEVHDSGKKRASEVTPAKDMHVKRAKIVSRDDDKKSGADNKKVNSPRVWSEEDEISVLQGMIDFEADTGKNPCDDMNGFYDITKKFISFDVSKSQLREKIRSLKRKYVGNDKKVKEESSFSKPHDKKCLGLAKYIWGSDGMAPESAAVKSPVKSKKKVEKNKLDLEEVENEVVDPEVVKANEKEKKVESLKLTGDKVDEAVESDVVKANEKEKEVESLKLRGDKVEEVVNLGGDTESSNWFDNSFLVHSCASLGANESSVKQKWSKVPIETKNRIQEKLKLVEAKEYELLSQKTEILKEVLFVMSEAI